MLDDAKRNFIVFAFIVVGLFPEIISAQKEGGKITLEHQKNNQPTYSNPRRHIFRPKKWLLLFD